LGLARGLGFGAGSAVTDTTPKPSQSSARTRRRAMALGQPAGRPGQTRGEVETVRLCLNMSGWRQRVKLRPALAAAWAA